ncbi:Uma2 family endonuclease [Phormidium tenue]|jgi:Uma2 family endonuclease|uniref:Uma2 family endonuclease n=1 Tax=Phormidium tenue FACHB-1050 TaxID=2692857 RepID=A0ABR8CEQ8_9CYAN|nr:Uma2 family endonuclease [Phormidium tenue]MBD2318425.1 Uma2 family endonuclease [Phormidium tenue FACHB-1050]
MVLATTKRYTVDEYLELEEKADFKSEFVNGDIIPMAGATANHNILTAKFLARILLALEDLDYAVFMSDMRLWMPDQKRYTYPDVMVVEGQPIFTDEKQTGITNPCLIVEVLSNSTGEYYRANKFKLYRSIASFREYILIDQSSYGVDQYTKRNDGKWVLSDYVGEDAILKLESVNFEISLRDLYKRVTF